MISHVILKTAMTLFVIGFPTLLICACLTDNRPGAPWKLTDKIGICGMAMTGGAIALALVGIVGWVWGV